MKLDFCFFPYQYFRRSATSKTVQNGTQQLSRASASLASGNEAGKNLERAVENEESLLPVIMPNTFIDAKVLLAQGLTCAGPFLPPILSLCVKLTRQKLYIDQIICRLLLVKYKKFHPHPSFYKMFVEKKM
jgi:hypothetical protein